MVVLVVVLVVVVSPCLCLPYLRTKNPKIYAEVVNVIGASHTGFEVRCQDHKVTLLDRKCAVTCDLKIYSLQALPV